MSNMGYTDNPIFIGGYMHSGTSLVMRVLSNAPGVYCRRWETRFFSHLPQIRKRFARLSEEGAYEEYVRHIIDRIWNGTDLGGARHLKGEMYEVDQDTVDDVLELISYDNNHTIVYRRVFDALALRAGASRWLEKTPGNIFHVDAILADIPDAYIVNVVRDPRDILASKKIRRSRISTDTELHPELRRERQLAIGYDPLWASLSWRSAAQAGRSATQCYPDHVTTVRYEELVTQPMSSVKHLCDLLGIGFDEDMLHVSAHGSAEGGTGSAEGPGVQRDRTERWNATLTNSEIAVCQLIVSSEMTDAGYEREEVGLLATVKLPTLITRSFADLFRRLIRKYQLGGLSYIRSVVSGWVRRAIRLIKG